MKKEEEKLEWQKASMLGPTDAITPVLNAMLMLVQMEQQKTEEQIEQVKKMLEEMKKKK